MRRHQIKISGRALAWIRAIVHAQQANACEWNGTHRHEGGKLNTAAKEALLQTSRLKARQPMLPNHRQGHRL